MKKVTIVLVACFSYFTVFSQLIDFNKIIPVTPEAAHLQKEVKIPVDFSTGVPNISIPLFELKTGNISVPISISYHASGIQVGQLSSSVGLGWGLNAGGAVQRTIRGRADNASGGWFQNNFTNYYVSTIENNYTLGNNDYLLSGDGDFTQDDYSYNFLNYSGSFFFDSTKAVRTVMRDPLKLEYNSSPPTSFTAYDFSGFSYDFDSADYSYSTRYPSNTFSNNVTGGESSWRLTKIKYQDADSVTFDYDRYFISYLVTDGDVYDWKGIFLTCKPYTTPCVSCGDDYPTTTYTMISQHNYDNSLVKQIQSRDTKVNFYYSSDATASIWQKKLDSILITSLIDNTVKKRIYLTYSKFSGCNQFKLLSVKKLDVATGQFEETKFQYYEDASNPLPAMGSRSKDMFGYFNGKSNTTLIVSNDIDYTASNADRTINAATIALGTLKRVTYATGGFSEFVYEPNKASDTTYGAGIRVKEEDDYNAIDSNLNKTTYAYYGFHGRSLIFPYYMIADEHDGTYQRKIFSSDEPNNYRVPLGIVPSGYLYDSVVISSKGKTHDLKTGYKYDYVVIYNSYRAFPKEVTYYKYDAGSSTYVVTQRQRSIYNPIVITDHSTPLLGVMPPKLTPFAVFADVDALCYQYTNGFYTEYSYTENAILKTNEKTVAYSNGDSAVEETRYYYGNMDHLQPTRIVKLNSIDSTITTIKYPAEMVSSGLDGSGIYQTMVNFYMWGPAIIEETFNAQNSSLSKNVTTYVSWSNLIGPQLMQVGLKGNTPETRKQINNFDANGNITDYSEDSLNTLLLWDYNKALPVAKIVNASSTNVAYTSFEASGNGWTLNGGSTTTTYSMTGKKAYTLSSGNSITSSGHVTRNYIVSYWSRNGSMTVNSTSGTAGMTKNGWTYYEHRLPSVSSITLSGTGTIDELRLYPQGALMTTYSYEPMVGVSSICDAANRVSYFEYDGMGRLYLVRDMDKNILKKINYNLTQSAGQVVYYNAELSQQFQKNDCGTGYQGGYITYTVAAGRYSSTISQADANAQAQLEINNLGQQYTNANASCTAIPTCNSSNCPPPSKHCVSDVCTRGLRVYSSSTYNPSTGMYDCYWHYEWSDGFQSADFYEQSASPCM